MTDHKVMIFNEFVKWRHDVLFVYLYIVIDNLYPAPRVCR